MRGCKTGLKRKRRKRRGKKWRGGERREKRRRVKEIMRTEKRLDKMIQYMLKEKEKEEMMNKDRKMSHGDEEKGKDER